MTQLLLVILVALSNAATTGPAWDWTQDVAYQENHDPGMIWLRDGRRLHVRYTEITWKEVDAWAKDKPLQLAYSPSSGLVLLDPASKRTIPVLSGTEHPIDLLTEACIAKHQTTMGMIECYGDAYGRWDQELGRAYKQLLDSLDDKHRDAVEKSQKAWGGFRTAELKAISAVYDKEGTINRVENARQTMNLVRDRARRLESFLE